MLSVDESPFTDALSSLSAIGLAFGVALASASTDEALTSIASKLGYHS
jgi:hypothetical protein